MDYGIMVLLCWDLAIARYQPRLCGQQGGFAPTFFLGKIFGNFFLNIFLVHFFLENIFGEKQYFVLKKVLRKYFFEKYFWRKCFDENIFGKNIVHGNILDENILGKNIFFSPFPHLTAQQTTPTSSQLLISDFWSWVWHNERNELTDRTEHTMIVPFIVLDYCQYTTHRMCIAAIGEGTVTVLVT